MTETQAPTNSQRESRLSVRQVVSVIVAVAVAAGFGIIGLSLGLPYKPATIDRYSILPNVLCPGQEITVKMGYNVPKPTLGSVRSFSVTSTLVKKDAPDRVGFPVTSFPFDGAYGYHDQISPVKRFAPNDPGVWHLETALTTNGTQILRPVNGTVTGIKSDPVTVLPFADTRCQAVLGD